MNITHFNLHTDEGVGVGACEGVVCVRGGVQEEIMRGVGGVKR